MQTTYPISTSGILCTQPNALGSAGGHNTLQFTAPWGQIDFQITATETISLLEVQCYSAGSDHVYVSIDGGGYSDAGNSSGGFAYVSLATNLAAGSHRVSLRFNNSDSSTYIDSDASIRATTGTAAPTISGAAGFSFFAPVLTSPYSSAVAYAAWTAGNVGGYNLLSTTWTNNPVRIKGRFQGTFKIYTFANESQYALLRDGQRIAVVTASNSQQFEYLTLAAGLTDTADHIYDIYPGIANGDSYQEGFLYAFGGDGTINTSTTPTFGRHIAVIGDSIACGNLATDKINGWVPLAVLGHGYDLDSRALSGQTAYYWGQNNTAPIVNLTSAPARMVHALGVNDERQAGGAETTTQYQGAVTSILNAYMAAWPGVPIDVMEITPSQGYTDPSAWNAALAAGVAASTNPSVCALIPTGSFLIYPDDYADGLHPTDAGHAKIAAGYVATIGRIAATGSLYAGEAGTITGVCTFITPTTNPADYSVSQGVINTAVPVVVSGSTFTLTLSNPGAAGSLTVTTQGVTSNAVTVLAEPVTSSIDLTVNQTASTIVEFRGRLTLEAIKNTTDIVHYTVSTSNVECNSNVGRLVYRDPITVAFPCTITFKASSGNKTTVRCVLV